MERNVDKYKQMAMGTSRRRFSRALQYYFSHQFAQGCRCGCKYSEIKICILMSQCWNCYVRRAKNGSKVRQVKVEGDWCIKREMGTRRGRQVQVDSDGYIQRAIFAFTSVLFQPPICSRMSQCMYIWRNINLLWNVVVLKLLHFRRAKNGSKVR